jgi:GT2 family glycosyltransferase
VSGTVSVIIPTFNRAYLLREAVQSVLDQTYRDLEVIVVDDGSTDGTQDSVANWFGADPRVRYAAQANQGASAARNAGLDLATGGYIAFLDSDDSWKPWHLELTLACLALYPQAGLIWTNIEFVDDRGAVAQPSALRHLLSNYGRFPLDTLFGSSASLTELDVDLPPGGEAGRLYVGDIFSPMVMGNLILASSSVLRRDRVDQVGRFDQRLVMGEDYEFFLRVCRAGPVAFVDLDDVRYRVGNADKLSGLQSPLAMATSYLRVLDATLARDRDRISLSPAMIAQARTHAHQWVGEIELLNGSRRSARAHLGEALRIDPWRASTIALYGLTFLPSAALEFVLRGRRGLRALIRRGVRPSN